MQCPLCRTRWGENAIEILQENTRLFKQSKKDTAAKENQVSKTLADQQSQQKERSFQCHCCKRSINYDAKYQCVVCENIKLCKLCFRLKNHEHH